MLLISPLEDTENVDPEEAAGPDVDHPEAGGDQEEVDGLGRHPEQAGTLEGRDELLSDQETVESQLTKNNSKLTCTQ